ncbi:MAG TPA: hypothetical protein ENJ82_14435 [Bacteroidetes bacterium]|nr:hypothetical protein [Bacteroidota bacterium]
MNRFNHLLPLLILLTLFFGCEKEIISPQSINGPTLSASGLESLVRPDVQCGTSRFSVLKSSNGDLYGSVEVLNDADNVYLLIEMEPNKFLDATQAFFGTSSAIPTDGNGSILMEDFQFQSIIARGAARYTIIMPLSSMPNCPDIVLWGQASQKNMFGQTVSNREVWLTGIPIYNGSFFKYCAGACTINLGASDVSRVN